MSQLREGLPMLGELRGAARLLLLPRAYVRSRMPTEEARRILQARLEQREADFLDLAQHAIYEQPSSPYRDLMEVAGCELGDLQRLVRQEGLDGALRALYRSGVYLTLDELKGRRPAVRGSATIPVGQTRLRNPGQAPRLTGSGKTHQVHLQHPSRVQAGADQDD